MQAKSKKKRKKQKKTPTNSEFRRIVWSYYKTKGRGDLAWRERITPYRILVSEVMLQQTQVARVKDYFPRFLARFPNVKSLAAASQPDVLEMWQGLGYNRRAVFLHRAAKLVMEKHGGIFPEERRGLEDLPGIGPATSGALMAFAFNKPAVFIETNIRRAYLHHFFPGVENVPDAAVLKKIEKTLPKKDFRQWYWALMDYGAMLAKKAKENPNRRSKHYTKQSKFEGSVRQVRGAILRYLLKEGGASWQGLQKNLSFPKKRLKKALVGLEKEGVVTVRNNLFVLSK